MKPILTSMLVFGLALSSAAALAQAQQGRSGDEMKFPLTKAEHAKKGAEMFGKWDTNGDGTITREEFTAAHDAKFTKMDTNNDGTVSAEEHRAAMQEKKSK
ncbi:hypothetical protein [Pedomonas sp. V897]|uniref:hypothetical protein n=1 Tax=Pedomonas sp. V897 TaxID=3446482 RepID=UPI003EE1A426